jgi:RND family efflux transporter MFP subunit
MVLAALGARTMRTRSLALGIAAILGVVACGCGGNAGTPVTDDVAAATTAPARAASAVSTAAAPRSEARVPAASDILSVLSVEHQVDLAAERDGVVLAVSKDEGNAVRAGDVLAQLDDRDLQMQLVKAGDDLRVVQYKEAEVKAKDAAFRRQQELRQYGLSSEADLEQAEFEAKGAEYDLHGWQALVESSEAEVRQIQIEIDQTRVRAPFSGVVVSRYIRQGEALKKGDRCFRVSQLAPLEVRFQVPESSPQRPRRGAPVALSLVSNSSALTARIVKISPTVDPASDSYDVVAQLPETRRSELLPGMAVRVHWPAAAPAKPQP